MAIFDIYNNEPVINPEGLFIPELRAIWDRDETDAKHKATNELLYVYHMVDPKSSYSRYPLSEKENKILEAYFEQTPDWKPDEVIQKAMDRYKEMKQSVAVRYLKGVEAMIDKLAVFLLEEDIQAGTGGNLTQILAAVTKGEDLINTYAKLLARVNSELEAFETKYKKGVKPSEILD